MLYADRASTKAVYVVENLIAETCWFWLRYSRWDAVGGYEVAVVAVVSKLNVMLVFVMLLSFERECFVLREYYT